LEVSIGTKLKALRLQAGLTQVQLAQAAGILQSALARYEQDQDVPSAPRIVAIAKALGTTVEEIVEESSLPTTDIEPAQDRRVHGNSTAAQIQKLAQQLDPERQKGLLHHARLLMTNQESEQSAKSNSTTKRRNKAA
jgi:transcriptional regulator with XRE-family HTH domain